MVQRYEGQVVRAKQSQAVAAGAGTTFAGPTAAVHANGTGSLVGTLAGDSAVSTYNVVEGMTYNYGFISIDASNGVAVVALFN